MSSEDQQSGYGEDSKTARTVGQLVKYSREVNQSDTVEEVGSYALEATFHVMEGHPAPSIVGVHEGELRVIESMSPAMAAGGEPTALERYAYEHEQTVVLLGEEVGVGSDTSEITAVQTLEDVAVVTPADIGIDPPEATLTIAVPSVYGDTEGDTGVIVSVRWSSVERVAPHHVRPLEYLADHVATAINNIRSRERLERARNDLAKRKELVEMYDSLLRHDLGNDLQIIAGYADTLVAVVDDGAETAEYAENIRQTTLSASELVENVGHLVKRLEGDREPEPTDLRPILSEVVSTVDTKYESLTVEFDPESVDDHVYAGDLLDSVFTNILANAAVHNDDPVTVRVGVEEPTPETVTVVFADDGTGVPPDVREDIFKMGEKGPDSDGSGLGLGFVRALTTSYGGDVTVADSDRGGAAFRVTLERA